MIHILGINRVVLQIADLDCMIAFYCNVLGFAVVSREDDTRPVQLRAGNALIEFVPARGASGVGGGNSGRLCLRIESFDEVALRVHLREAGVEVGPVERRHGGRAFGLHP